MAKVWRFAHVQEGSTEKLTKAWKVKQELQGNNEPDDTDGKGDEQQSRQSAGRQGQSQGEDRAEGGARGQRDRQEGHQQG
eukprot:6677340-Lingulodinium_polyedra.AAC.1